MRLLKLNKNGSALVIALFFAFCMLILLGALVFRQTNTASHNKISLLDRQVFFATRSAMQHFLLKAKLFPTELYDAVEISQGKNPFFNFTEFSIYNEITGEAVYQEFFGGRANLYVKVKKPNIDDPENELDTKGNPRYYYIKLPNKDWLIRVASYNNPDYRYLAPNIADDDQNKKYTDPRTPSSDYKADKYLKYYYRDCGNYNENVLVSQQPLLVTEIAPGIKNINKFDIATEDGYPYTLQYYIQDVKVKAIQEMRKYNEEAIEIKVAGKVINYKNQSGSQNHVKTEKITREEHRGSI